MAALATGSLWTSFARARTDGTWIADADGTWTDAANWFNGGVANGFGNANIGSPSFPSIIGNFTASHTITLNSGISLNSLTFYSPFTFSIVGSGSFSSLGTINTPSTAYVANPVDTSNQFQFGDLIGVKIAGGSVSKVGSGAITLTGANTFSGFTLNAGTVYVTDNNDAALGSISVPVGLAGGTVLGNTSTSGVTFTTGRNFNFITSGTVEFRNFAPMTINGNISTTLTNSLVHRSDGSGGGTLTIGGTANYGGLTIIRDNDFIRVAGAGNLPATTGFTLDGTLVLDNSTTANASRINNSGTFDANGGGIMMIGNASTAINEGLGQIALDGGMSQIDLMNRGANVAVTTAAITRSGRSTAFIHGDLLGAGNGAANSNVYLTSPPLLVGGSGLAGSNNISIVPWMIGNNTGTTTLNGSNNSFMTYGANGLRPLDLTTEYSTTLATGTNVRLSAAAINNSPVTVNALITPGFNLTGTGAVTITSGALAITGQGALVTTPINFGTAEGIVHATSSGTLSGVISGSNGLTKSGFNTLTLAAANNYSGPTTIVAGTIALPGNIPTDGSASPLGTDIAGVVLYGGTYASAGIPRLYSTPLGTATNQNYTFQRQITLNNATVDSAGAIGLSAAAISQNDNITFTKPITVNGGTLRLEGDPGATITFNGAIGGSGGLTDEFGSRQVIVGSNNYSGGTTIKAGTWLVNGTNPLGGGTVTFTNTSLPTAANPYPGAIGPAFAAQTLTNNLLIASKGPSDGAGYLGVPIVGNSAFVLNGLINLNGEERTFDVLNTAGVTLGMLINGGFDKQGPGTVYFNSQNEYTGNTKVESGTLSLANNQFASNLIVYPGAYAEIFNNSLNYDKFRSLDLGSAAAATGTFNITSRQFIVNNNTPFSTIQSYVSFARNGGQWDRPGITSSLARPVTPGGAIKPTGIGIVTGAEYLTAHPGGSFGPFPFTSTDTLVKYTWNGDADLNGVINANDYSQIDSGYQNQNTAGFVFDWFHGDFDYNGTINANDYALIDAAYQQQSGTLRDAIDFLETGELPTGELSASLRVVVEHHDEFGQAYAKNFIFANVPEPTGVAFVGVAMSALFRRRR